MQCNIIKTFKKLVGFYGPIAPPGQNAPSSECPPNTCHVKGVARSLFG